MPRRRPEERLGTVKEAAATLPSKALYRGHIWSYDFIFDWTEQGQELKMLEVIDEYSHECHGIKVGLTLNSSDMQTMLAELFAQHGAPEYLRSDNSGEFIAAQLKLWLERRGASPQRLGLPHTQTDGAGQRS